MKTICVPKNHQAQIDLDFDEAKQDELIELILDDSTVNELFKTDFISSINQMAGVNIDNYEDEKISDMNKLVQISNSNLFDKKQYDSELFKVIDKIHALFRDAITFKTGIYFYF